MPQYISPHGFVYSLKTNPEIHSYHINIVEGKNKLEDWDLIDENDPRLDVAKTRMVRKSHQQPRVITEAAPVVPKRLNWFIRFIHWVLGVK